MDQLRLMTKCVQLMLQVLEDFLCISAVPLDVMLQKCTDICVCSDTGVVNFCIMFCSISGGTAAAAPPPSGLATLPSVGAVP